MKSFGKFRCKFLEKKHFYKCVHLVILSTSLLIVLKIVTTSLFNLVLRIFGFFRSSKCYNQCTFVSHLSLLTTLPFKHFQHQFLKELKVC